MWDTVGAELLRLGLPGIVILTLAYVYWQKDKRLSEVENARTSDAKAVTATLLEMRDKDRQTIEALRQTIAVQTPVIERMDDLMREVKDAVRKK